MLAKGTPEMSNHIGGPSFLARMPQVSKKVKEYVKKVRLFARGGNEELFQPQKLNRCLRVCTCPHQLVGCPLPPPMPRPLMRSPPPMANRQEQEQEGRVSLVAVAGGCRLVGRSCGRCGRCGRSRIRMRGSRWNAVFAPAGSVFKCSRRARVHLQLVHYLRAWPLRCSVSTRLPAFLLSISLPLYAHTRDGYIRVIFLDALALHPRHLLSSQHYFTYSYFLFLGAIC